MHKVGDKFIIEIDGIIEGGQTKMPQYRIKGFDKVFFDDKGLKCLNPYNDQDDEFVWKVANYIMNIPIKERAKLFGVSYNSASFKDISSKFTFAEVLEKFLEHVDKKANDISNTEKVKEFAKENNLTITDIESITKILLQQGINNVY